MTLAPSDIGRRRLIGGLMAGGVVTAASLAGGSAAHAAPADGALATNVKDPAYGALGDGTTDDTAAIQAAIDATPNGGICFFPPGAYLVQSALPAIVTGVSGVSLVGAGATVSMLKVAAASTAQAVLNLTRRSDVTVQGLGFDGTASTPAVTAIYAAASGGQRGITIDRCRFAGFMSGQSMPTAAAVYVWTAFDVQVIDSAFIDCGRAITLDQPEGPCRVSGNRISASGASTMATGIWVRRSSGFSTAGVVVSENQVFGARLDPGGVGADGHGIAVYRCQDVRVLDNYSEGNGRGILISNGSFGALVQGNTCVANNDAGIRVEPEIASKDISIGAGGTRRGVTVVGNVSRNNVSVGAPSGANVGMGIAMSYAAGSTVSGNVVHNNSGDGIVCDSDRVTIVGNIVYDNWTGYTAEPSIGRRGGIRIYAASGCTVVGNQCFDNQSTKTQKYGLSLSAPGGAHVVQGNQLSGNGTADVWGAEKMVESFFGVTPVGKRPHPGKASAANSATVLNNLVKSLQELGLIS